MTKPIRHTTSAGGVVLGPNNMVLVVNQRGLSWSLPKGHIETGETAQEAAQREIYEESGVNQLTFVSDLGSYDRYKLTKENGDDLSELKTIVLFLFTTKQLDLKPIDPHNPVAQWVPINKVADLLSHPKDAAFFRSLQATLPQQ